MIEYGTMRPWFQWNLYPPVLRFAPRWRWFASCSLSCSLVLVTFFPRPVSASTCHPFVPVLDLFMNEIHTALHNSTLTLPIYTCQFAPGTVCLKDSRGTTSRTRFIVPGTQPDGLDEVVRVRNHEGWNKIAWCHLKSNRFDPHRV